MDFELSLPPFPRKSVNFIKGCPILICLYLNLTKYVSSNSTIKFFWLLIPSPFLIWGDRHLKERWTKEGKNGLHNCPTLYHVTKVEIHVCRSPSFPGWGHRAGPKGTSGGRMKSPSTGVLDLKWTSKVSWTFSTGEWTSRRFSQVPYFTKRWTLHEVHIYHLKDTLTFLLWNQ